MLLWTLLIACPPDHRSEDSGDPAVCPTARDLPVLASCVVPLGAEAPDLSVEHALSLTDVAVRSTGSGPPSSGCVEPAAWAGLTEGGTVEGSSTAWALLEDGEGARYEVALTLPGEALSWDLPTRVDLLWEWDGFEPFDGRYGDARLELRGTDGTLLAWADTRWGEAPPELRLTRTGEDCRTEVECGVRVDYVVEASLDGEEARLRAGQARRVGSYTVAMGHDYELEELSCSETAGERSAFGLARGAD